MAQIPLKSAFPCRFAQETVNQDLRRCGLLQFRQYPSISQFWQVLAPGGNDQESFGEHEVFREGNCLKRAILLLLRVETAKKYRLALFSEAEFHRLRSKSREEGIPLRTLMMQKRFIIVIAQLGGASACFGPPMQIFSRCNLKLVMQTLFIAQMSQTDSRRWLH